MSCALLWARRVFLNKKWRRGVTKGVLGWRVAIEGVGDRGFVECRQK